MLQRLFGSKTVTQQVEVEKPTSRYMVIVYSFFVNWLSSDKYYVLSNDYDKVELFAHRKAANKGDGMDHTGYIIIDLNEDHKYIVL